MEPQTQLVPESTTPEQVADSAEVVDSVSWSSVGHERTEKSDDWYWVVWIIAGSCMIAVLFFLQIIPAILIMLAAGTIVLLAKSELTAQEYMIDAKGIAINEVFHPYEFFQTFEVIERPQKPTLLILATSTMLNPHFFVNLAEGMEADDVRDFLKEFIPEANNGVPISHQIVEYFGL